MKIFVSYSSKNRTAIQSLIEDLEGLDHDVWFDQELAGGQKWWDTILENIRTCDIFLFAMTQDWVASRACELESDYAIRLQKICLPLLLDDVNVGALRSTIQQWQIVDYRSQDKEAYRRLIRALQTLPSSPPLPEHLPIPPSMPLSPLAEIADELKANPLSSDRQEVLLIRLRELLATESDAARDLLRQLYKHPSAIPPIIESILQLLGEETLMPKPKSEVSKDIRMEEVAFEQAWFDSFHRNLGDVTGIAFLRNGKQFVTLSSYDENNRQDTGLILWDASYFQPIKRVRAPELQEGDIYPINDKGILFPQAPQDNEKIGRPVRAFLGLRVELKLWNFTDGFFDLQGLPTYKLYTVAPDGKHFAATIPFKLLIYSIVISGKLGGIFGSKILLRHLETIELPPNSFYQMVFCGETNQYLICSTTGPFEIGGKLVIYEWEKRMQVRQWDKEPFPILKIALSPNGNWLAIATARTLRVWDWHTQETFAFLDFLQAGIIDESDPEQEKAFPSNLWSEEEQTPYDICEVKSVAFSPDNKWIVFSTVFRPLKDELIRNKRDHNNVRVEPGFRAKLWLWDFSSGRQPIVIETAYAPHKSLTFSPDGKHLVAGIKDHVKVWQIT